MTTERAITIQGTTFDVTPPYAEGHALTENEARVLNQTWCENVRNNCAKAVKEAEDEQGAIDFVSEYAKNYTFAVPSAGGGRERLDPVEREARKIARSAIREQLATQGRKLADVDKDKLAAAVISAAENPEIQKLAKKRVKDMEAAKVTDLSALGIGSTDGEATDSGDQEAAE